MSSKYGFKCSFNLTFRDGSGERHGWISKGYYGLDQGPIVLMIENYRSGFFWRLMRQCPHIVIGLRRAGFRAGYQRLKQAAREAASAYELLDGAPSSNVISAGWARVVEPASSSHRPKSPRR